MGENPFTKLLESKKQIILYGPLVLGKLSKQNNMQLNFCQNMLNP